TLVAEGIDAAQVSDSLRQLGVAVALPAFDAPLRLTAQASGESGGTWTGHAEIATDGAVTWSPIRADGPLQIAADVQADRAARTLSDGEAEVRRVAVGALILDRLESGFAYARGAARVTQLRAAAFGGTWTYSGTLPVSSATAWSGQLSATGLSAAALRGAFA